MKTFISAALAAFMLLASTAMPALAKDITREIPVTDDFLEFDLGGYLMRIVIIRGDKFYEVCGSGIYTKLEAQAPWRRILRDSNLDSNGKRALKGLNYFTRVNKRSKLIGSMAKCRATNVPNSVKSPGWEFDWTGHRYYY